MREALGGSTRPSSRPSARAPSSASSLLNGQRAFLTAAGRTAGARVDHDALQRMMAEDDELCDLMLRTLWARREMLRRGPAARTLKIVGPRVRRAVALRRFAERLDLCTPRSTPTTRDTLDIWSRVHPRRPAGGDRAGRDLPQATPGQVAEMLGLAYTAEDDAEFDLAVVGAGPAGSPRRSTGPPRACAPCCSTPSRPAASRRRRRASRTTSGFPFGVSGDDLTAQASLQAIKFGVRIARRARRALDADTGVHRLTLADGAVVARGGRRHHRRRVPPAPPRPVERLRGRRHPLRGHHAGAPPGRRTEVVVMGGANSAGQAALALAANGCHVRLVVRRRPRHGCRATSSTASSRTPHRRAHRHAGRRPARRRRPSASRSSGAIHDDRRPHGLFCFIGAEPATDWLVDLERDEDGSCTPAPTSSGSATAGATRRCRCRSRPRCRACSRPATCAAAR